MRARAAAMAGLTAIAIVTTIATGGAARAENVSAVETIVLETDFSLCTDGGGARNCSGETWSISILPDGWKLGAVSRFESGREQWSEQCKNGDYQSTAGGGGWVGECKVRGDASSLCLEADVTQGPNAGMKAVSVQCFTIREGTCDMTMTGVSNFPDENGEDQRFVIETESVNFCTVSR